MLGSSPRARCCLCAATAWRRWYSEPPWEVWRCDKCGLGRTWPEPSRQEIERSYGPGYYQAHGMGGGDRQAWRERAQAILDRLPSRPASVLDFGAGEGQLVAAFRDLGLRADGVEPSPVGRRAASGRLGLQLLSATPEPAEYDLITAVHVLEHVADPRAELSGWSRCASARAAFFIEVPNADSIDLWSAVRRREVLQLPGHLVHFTPATAERLVREAGLEPILVEVSNPALLEGIFALRARWQSKAHRTRPPVCREAVDGAHFQGAPRTPPLPLPGWRRYWADRVLPALRRHVPGCRIHIVATRARAGG